MTYKPRLIILASAATLALALAQPVCAEGEQAPAAAPAPGPRGCCSDCRPPRPPLQHQPRPGAPADTAYADAHQRMEAHMAEMTAERNRRYGELRQRAAEVGLELPETPPWEQAYAPMPDMRGCRMSGMQGMQGMSGMQGCRCGCRAWRYEDAGHGGYERHAGHGGNERHAGLSAEEREAMRAAHYQAMRERAKAAGIDLPETPPAKLMTPEERRAHWEKMQSASAEERQAARVETYKQLRERAKAQGIDLPETPPWEQAQQRRKAMQEKWEAYRKQVDAMTEEQREAARAIFSGGPGDQAPPMPMERPMPQMPQMPQMPMRDAPDAPDADGHAANQGPQGFGPGPCPQGDCETWACRPAA